MSLFFDAVTGLASLSILDAAGAVRENVVLSVDDLELLQAAFDDAAKATSEGSAVALDLAAILGRTR